MANYYCKHCGNRDTNVKHLTSVSCARHPLGSHKGKHILYEGSEKSQYQCKYCGEKSNLILTLTSKSCVRHPNGSHKGKHEPAI